MWFLVLFYFDFLFETRSYYVGMTGLELTMENSLTSTQIGLPQIYECWD